MVTVGDLITYLLGLGTAIVTRIVTDLAGSRIQYRITFARRRFLKWLRNYKTELIVSLKPKNWVGGELDKVLGIVRERLREENIECYEASTNVPFVLVNDETKAEGEFAFGLDEEGKAEDMEVILKYPVLYQKFADDFLDLTQTMHRLEQFVRVTFPEAQEFSTALSLKKLKHFADATGVLAEYGLTSLSSTKDNIQFDLSRDMVVLYGQINADLRRLIQSLVVYYC